MFCAAILAILLPILLFRWLRGKVLWSVRNRLILTYLLMGLAPVVLFGTLSSLSTYIFAGQFAINTALSSRDQLLSEISSEATGVADSYIWHSSTRSPVR